MTGQTGKYTFEAGETYRTCDGGEARLNEVSGWGMWGRVYIVQTDGSDRWGGMAWDIDGKARHSVYDYRACAFDLLPPKRQIWVAVWQDRKHGDVISSTWDTESTAMYCVSNLDRLRIAVLGPFDVKPT